MAIDGDLIRLRVIYAVVAPIAFVHTAVAMAVFVRRRKVFPIRGRSVPLVAIAVVCSAFHFGITGGPVETFVVYRGETSCLSANFPR